MIARAIALPPTRLLLLLLFPLAAVTQSRPNIICILTDDMGLGDLGVYHHVYATPNLDKIAAGGIRFTNYYSASPVCSPSRVGYITGMAPAKWNITNYLNTRRHNRACQQQDFLDPAAPTISKLLQASGYATAHFGKWHMGGGRDVDNAPSISEYGLDEWSSTWESPVPDPLLTAGNWIWTNEDSIKRWDRTAYFVDKTIAFLEKNRGKPCYINLWPDDVHTPWVPFKDTARGGFSSEESFVKVLHEYDKQMGRLIDYLSTSGLARNTIVIFTSDNGPAPNFRHQRSAGLRGQKISLYEGGIRMPMLVWAPGFVKKPSVDSTSVIVAMDLMPSLGRLAGLKVEASSDGQDMSKALMGQPTIRATPVFWEYGRSDNGFFNYPKPADRSPQLAMRSGHWKFLLNADGSGAELYHLQHDPGETKNLAEQEKLITQQLAGELLAWWNSLPKLNKE